jgi:hypothetical protein
VQRLAGADLALGSIEEADELDVAVAQHEQPITGQSNTPSAANRVVVAAWRL